MKQVTGKEVVMLVITILLLTIISVTVWGMVGVRSKCVTVSPESMSGRETTSFSGYRVGDVYKFGFIPYSFAWKDDKDDRQYDPITSFHLDHFPGTIASEYILNTNKKPFSTGIYDKESMRRAFGKVCSELLPKIPIENTHPDAIFDFDPTSLDPTNIGTPVVHIRLGDVINKKTGKLNPRKGFEPEVYDRLAEHLGKDGTKRVILLCGVGSLASTANSDDRARKTNDMLEQIRMNFIKHGIKTIVVRNSPDEDLCLMGTAPKIVPSLSGFARIAADIGRARGAEVIDMKPMR